MTKDELVEKIKKILALAESSNPNEAAVALFLQEKITFLQIEECIERVMNSHNNIIMPDLQTILHVDSETRKTVAGMVK